MLFIDYSSAFNTIVPSKLINKLRTLELNTFCNCILDSLGVMGRPQVVRVVNNTSATLSINMGAPQGCVLSPRSLITSPFTVPVHSSLIMVRHNSSTIIKFADDNSGRPDHGQR